MIDINKINLSATTNDNDIEFIYHYLKPFFIKVFNGDCELYNDFIMILIKSRMTEKKNLWTYIYTVAMNLNKEKWRNKKSIIYIDDIHLDLIDEHPNEIELKKEYINQFLTKNEIEFIEKYHQQLENKDKKKTTNSQRVYYSMLRKKLVNLKLKWEYD